MDAREGNGSLAAIASEHQRKGKKGQTPAFSTAIAGGKLEQGSVGFSKVGEINVDA